MQQCLQAGLVGEMQVHLAPVMLGGGTRLFGEFSELTALEKTRVIDSPAVTHLRFEVSRPPALA